jgi:hypothetical protein
VTGVLELDPVGSFMRGEILPGREALRLVGRRPHASGTPTARLASEILRGVPQAANREGDRALYAARATRRGLRRRYPR